MEEITKEEIEKLMSSKIKTRGAVFQTDSRYVSEKMGQAELRKVEDELKRMGHPFKYKEIKSMAFYPAGLRMLSLLAIKKTFNFDDEKIKEMGLFATKKSLIIKMFTRYFLSMERVFYREAPRLWQKHWTQGTLTPVELNEKEKYAILRLEDFDLHPLYCSVYLSGYFSGILQIVTEAFKITCRETKCTFSLKRDEYHEYLLKWSPCC